MFRLDVARDDAAARESTIEGDPLFVGPDHHLERVTRAQVAGGARLNCSKRRQRTKIAVEIAAAWDRVDMRSEKNRRQSGVASRSASEDVSGSVDRRFETGRAHQLHDVGAALNIRLRVGDTAHAVDKRTPGGPAEEAQFLDAAAQEAGIDTQPGASDPLPHGTRNGRQRQSRNEVAPGEDGHELRSNSTAHRRLARRASPCRRCP
jgi:hypothetical protein